MRLVIGHVTVMRLNTHTEVTREFRITCGGGVTCDRHVIGSFKQELLCAVCAVHSPLNWNIGQVYCIVGNNGRGLIRQFGGGFQEVQQVCGCQNLFSSRITTINNQKAPFLRYVDLVTPKCCYCADDGPLSRKNSAGPANSLLRTSEGHYSSMLLPKVTLTHHSPMSPPNVTLTQPSTNTRTENQGSETGQA